MKHSHVVRVGSLSIVIMGVLANPQPATAATDLWDLTCYLMPDFQESVDCETYVPANQSNCGMCEYECYGPNLGPPFDDPPFYEFEGQCYLGDPEGLDACIWISDQETCGDPDEHCEPHVWLPAPTQVGGEYDWCVPWTR